MSYVNKSFTSNLDGSTVKIIKEIDPIIMQLDNGNRVSITRLKDPTFWTENIDPSQFFERDSKIYESFVNTIKATPDSMKESREGTIIKESGVYGDKTPASYKNTPEDINVPVYNQDPEEEKRALLKKYTGNSNAQAVVAQAEKMREYLDEDEIHVRLPPPVQVKEEPIVQVQVERSEEGEVTQVIINNEEHQQTREYKQPEIPNIHMFKGIKRNADFKVNLEINNKVPRADFISMWEDSYESSMIDYLAQEFTNNLLSDPDSIKNQIIDQLKGFVYGKENGKKEEKAVKVINKKPAKKVKDKRIIPTVPLKETEQLNEGIQK